MDAAGNLFTDGRYQVCFFSKVKHHFPSKLYSVLIYFNFVLIDRNEISYLSSKSEKEGNYNSIVT